MADDQFKDPRQPAETERKDDDPFAELARIVGFDEDEKKAKEEAESAAAVEPADVPPPTVDIPVRSPFTAPIPTVDVAPRPEPADAVTQPADPAPPPPPIASEVPPPPPAPPVAGEEPPPPPASLAGEAPPPFPGQQPPPPPHPMPPVSNDPEPVAEEEAALDLEAELLRELEIDVGEPAETAAEPPVQQPLQSELASEIIAARPQDSGPSFFDPPEPLVEEPKPQAETPTDPLSALLGETPEPEASAADPMPEVPVGAPAEPVGAPAEPVVAPAEPVEAPAEPVDNPWPGAAKASDPSVSSLEAELEAAFSALEDSGTGPVPESVEEAKAQIDAAMPPAETITESEQMASAYRRFEEDVQAAMPKATQLDETPDDINDALLAEMADVEAEAAAAAAAPQPEVPFDHASIADSDEVPEAMAELDVPELEPEEVVPAPSAEADFGLPLEEELEALASEAAEAVSDTRPPPERTPPPMPEPEVVAEPTSDPAPIEVPEAEDPVGEISLTEEELAEQDGALGEDDGFAMDEDLLVPEFDSVEDADRGQSGRRGLVAALVVLGVAIAGGGGFYYWNSSLGGDGTSDAAPVIVADSEPVKVKPENPGGKTVPNQDLAVYDRVAGNDTAAPQEQNLVTTTEEPVDVVQRTLEPGLLPLEGRSETAEPVVKSEDRLTASDTGDTNTASPEETVAIAPRKVRTLIVKPDGTIVARDLPAATEPSVTESAGGATTTPATDVASTQPAGTEAESAPSNEVTASNNATTSGEGGDQPRQIALTPAENADSTAATTPVETAAVTSNADTTQTQPSATESTNNAAATGNDTGPPPIDDDLRDTGAIPLPVNKPVQEGAATEVAAATTSNGNASTRAPVPSTRPSEQPVTIVEAVNERGNLAGSSTASAGGYSMQISSQPSEAGARESYQNLSRRYASIIGGRGVSIQRADIPNKGVFYRVRIPVGSRADATALCNQYKAAGGSCFVAR